jgi:glycosyltransferase involved in cell wall biosynthesis
MPEPPVLPSLAESPLSLLFLAHNDASHLHDVVHSWQNALAQLHRPFEVILVDDGSTDGTPFLAGDLAGVRLLGLAVAQGPGAALRVGLAAAQHPIVVSVPCDRQYRPEDLARLLPELEKAHLVSGYRVWQPVPWPLRVLGWTYRMVLRVVLAIPIDPLPGWLGWKDYGLWLLCRLLFGLRIHEVRCAFRVYRREIFGRIPIQSNSWFAHVEVLAKANFVGCVMADVPVPHTPRPDLESAAEHRKAWADFQRVCNKPDFGPPPA